jgi:mannosyltransferase
MTRLLSGHHGYVLLTLTVAGALLRFSTLDLQDIWLDEAVTEGLMRLDLRDMLVTIPATESTPPLYYLMARAWVLAFGSGEVGLRSLSALAGTLTIPVAYGAATAMTSRETGLWVAALTAVNPALVWYSQEARSYALFVFLSGLSLLFLARALRPGSDRDVVLWAVTAVLSLLTHYFAGFLILAEAIWLLARYPSRKLAGIAGGAVLASCAALLPLALHQRVQGNLGFIEESSLFDRTTGIGQLFLIGPTGGQVRYALPVLAALAVAALALLLRADGSQRRALLLPASLALAGVCAPVALALAGGDYVLDRNVLPFWLPVAIVVAVGLSASRSRRLGAALGLALVAGSLWLVAAVLLDRSRQREAATAALVPVRLDPREQRIAPRVTYVPSEGRDRASGMAACPPGYSAVSGGASWLSSGLDEPLPETSLVRDERGWGAKARPGNDEERTLSIYSICVRPAD